MESETKDKKRIIIQKSEICNYGTVRYLYENAAAREPGYTLSKGFKNSVSLLPLHYNKANYMQFIEHWGTVWLSIVIIVLSMEGYKFYCCSISS